VVDQVGDPSGEPPIITAILEEVAHGHGAVREAVDEKGFQIAFEVMESPAEQRRGDDRRSRRRRRAHAVNERRADVEEWEEEKGAGIFGEEDGDPTHLRSQVLEVEGFDVEAVERGVVL